jgi:hypothetical protein
VSRYVRTDLMGSGSPRELAEYTTTAGHLIRPGSQVEYIGPVPLPGGPHTVDELIDYGVPPVQAILNGGVYECSADNLRPVADPGECVICPPGSCPGPECPGWTGATR